MGPKYTAPSFPAVCLPSFFLPLPPSFLSIFHPHNQQQGMLAQVTDVSCRQAPSSSHAGSTDPHTLQSTYTMVPLIGALLGPIWGPIWGPKIEKNRKNRPGP